MGRTGTKVDALGTLGDVKAFVAVVVTLLIFELFIYLFNSCTGGTFDRQETMKNNV
jgi:hypothetical protein